MEPTMTDRLEAALRRAAAAHHAYEVELGGPHADWQRWYAEHMARSLVEEGLELQRISPA
jgi:hypothetical protein